MTPPIRVEVTPEPAPPPNPPPTETAPEVLRLAELAGAATQAVEALRTEIARVTEGVESIRTATADFDSRATTLMQRVDSLETRMQADDDAVEEAESEMIEPPAPVAPPEPPPEQAPVKPPGLLRRLMF